MDFTIRTVILLGIITICVLVASTTVGGAPVPPVIDTFTSANALPAPSTNSCARALVNVAFDKAIEKDKNGRFATPQAREELYSYLSQTIDQYMTLDATTFLRNRGINTSQLPANVISALPQINLMDLVNKFQQNNNIDATGNVIGRNECLIPMSLMQQFRNQTNEATIQLRDDIDTNLDMTNKQCKIGNTTTTTNIPKSITSERDAFNTIDQADPIVNRFQSYGCLLPTADIGETSFVNRLAEMYAYTDSKTMNTFRNTLAQYSVSLDTLGRATNNNLNAFDEMVTSAGERTAAEEAALSAKDNRIAKEGETAQATVRMEAAAKTASTNISALQTKLDLLA